MNKRLIILSLLLLAGFSATATVVGGRVSCDGAPLQGVAVSDGVKVVLTDAGGEYRIKSKLELGYVFISVPSGYQPAVDGVIPRFFARVSSEEKTATADFELVKVDQSKCKLIVYNDIHLTNDKTDRDLRQARKGFFPDVMALCEGLAGETVYGLTAGDMTSENKWYVNGFGLSEYLAEISRLPFPIYHCMGNHDNDMRAGGGDFKASATYRSVIGPNYYSLNIGAFHIVVLDNIYYDCPENEYKGYHAHLDDMQLGWLRADLKTVKADTPVILVAHAPFYRVEGVVAGEDKVRDGFNGGYYAGDVLNLFKKFPSVHIITAHTHENYYVQINTRMLEHNNIGVSAAAWKTARICGFNMIRDGVPGGYSVYSIEGDSLSWYYKAVGYAMEDCQFRAYDMNTVPEKFRGDVPDNTIWVNVFNYDPLWKVSVRENGKELEVRRLFLEDPLYAAALDGSRLAKGTFKSKPNNHMFSAQASGPGSTVEITVTDRFGRSFTKRMERPFAFGLDMNLGNK